MRNFQDTFEKGKRSFNSVFSIRTIASFIHFVTVINFNKSPTACTFLPHFVPSSFVIAFPKNSIFYLL